MNLCLPFEGWYKLDSDYDISFSQLYPLHRSELPLYSKIGLEAFWKHPGFDWDDPKRPAIVG
jgi:hypothetical protein